jgi:hypothetical protein
MRVLARRFAADAMVACPVVSFIVSQLFVVVN